MNSYLNYEELMDEDEEDEKDMLDVEDDNVAWVAKLGQKEQGSNLTVFEI